MRTSTHATTIIKCAIAAIAIASCAQAAPNDAEGVVQRLEKKNKELEETNRQLENQIVKIRGVIDDLNQEITALRDEIQTLKDENEVLTERLKSSTSAKPSAKSVKHRQPTNKIEARMAKIVLPRISFKPPATLVDAVEFFRRASIDLDDPKLPKEERGFNFSVQAVPDNGSVPVIPAIIAENINFLDALDLVLSSIGYKFEISGSMIIVLPQNMTAQQLFTRSYKIPEGALDKAFGTGNIKSLDEKNAKCLAWLRDKGIDWPENGTQKSAFVYVRAIECLRITNTAENIEKIEEQLKRLKILKAAGRK